MSGVCWIHWIHMQRVWLMLYGMGSLWLLALRSEERVQKLENFALYHFLIRALSLMGIHWVSNHMINELLIYKRWLYLLLLLWRLLFLYLKLLLLLDVLRLRMTYGIFSYRLAFSVLLSQRDNFINTKIWHLLVWHLIERSIKILILWNKIAILLVHLFLGHYSVLIIVPW